MTTSKDEISRRLDKHQAELLETLGLLRANRISPSEARDRNRAADKEYRAIRALINKTSRKRRLRKNKSESEPEFKNPFDKIRRTYTKPPGSRSKWP
jgi:hypothetical protein